MEVAKLLEQLQKNNEHDVKGAMAAVQLDACRGHACLMLLAPSTKQKHRSLRLRELDIGIGSDAGLLHMQLAPLL